MTARSDDCTRFVMLMLGRSGSSHLTALLDSHPHISAKGEKPSRMNPRKQMSWSRRFLETTPEQDEKARGFKIKRKDLHDPEGFAALLRELDVKVIMLRRRNLVKMTVSWLNAERIFDETGDWNIPRGAAPLGPLNVDPARFDRRLGLMEEAREALESYVEGLGLPVLPIYYEEMLADERGTLDRVFEFLEVSPALTRSLYRKSTKDDLAQAVGNFEELRSGYAGTRFQPFFDEVIAPNRPSDDNR